jgi:hypothetical protein
LHTIEAELRNQTAGAPPVRRASSLRRTISLQTFWPGGATQPASMAARGRDLFTTADVEIVRTLATEAFDAGIGPDDRLTGFDAAHHRNELDRFVGLAPGGPMRKAMMLEMPGESERGTLFHRLLDDMAGANFISKSAWYDWPGGIDGYFEQIGLPSTVHRSVEGVCISLAAGSEAVTPDGRTNEAIADHPFAPPAFSTTDPLAWHGFAPTPGPNQWRLRRTDIWADGDSFVVDAWFQDSAVVAGRTDVRRIFHEYRIDARFDRAGLRLSAIKVEPRVLPFRTCLAAPATAEVLLGQTPDTFRAQILQSLRGTGGCTHLNDMLRALQDVSALARALDSALQH